jgi:hypothetical protein
MMVHHLLIFFLHWPVQIYGRTEVCLYMYNHPEFSCITSSGVGVHMVVAIAEAHSFNTIHLTLTGVYLDILFLEQTSCNYPLLFSK